MFTQNLTKDTAFWTMRVCNLRDLGFVPCDRLPWLQVRACETVLTFGKHGSAGTVQRKAHASSQDARDYPVKQAAAKVFLFFDGYPSWQWAARLKENKKKPHTQKIHSPTHAPR